MIAAAGGALLLLVTIVLPAEYGIDVTGIGRILGLDKMAEHHHHPEPALSVFFPDTEYMATNTLVTLAPGEEIEFKASMEQGAAILFAWQTDRGELFSDFHGHNAEQAMQYRKLDAAASGSGSFAAPFTGEHGWYWVNANDFPVSIAVRVSGYHGGLSESGRRQRTQ